MEDKVYTVREFAKIFKISNSTAYKMVRENTVKSVRFGDRYLIPAGVVSEILAGTQAKAGNSAA